jgi:hypothetical protein
MQSQSKMNEMGEDRLIVKLSNEEIVELNQIAEVPISQEAS